jgi:hypothetical protein
MKEIIFKLYAFEELSDTAKQHAADMWNESNDCNECISDDMYLLEPNIKDIKSTKVRSDYKKLNEPLFSWEHVYYDTDQNWCIEFQELEVSNDDLFLRILGIPIRLRNKLTYNFSFSGIRYYTTIIEFTDFYSLIAFTKRELAILDKAACKFNDMVQTALLRIRDEQEYQQSYEVVSETLIANEYHFYENGKMH